ncbi:hypothetical protein BJV82DRAFT_611431 [Fennellomyces sp. T-0311]|nr:hypothetical protein BJV82DRAFT_611431 [Fennellomyces sp. T-0311]
MPLIPGFAPIPHVELILLLSKFALVILTNEHNISQVHSSCDTRIQRVQGTYTHCPHIIKRRRALTLAGNRGRKVKWCFDEAGVFLHPQADCEQGQARYTEIWSIKQCRNELAHGRVLFVDRDKNAACNIRRIGIQYMLTDGAPNHRPNALVRPPHENERN